MRCPQCSRRNNDANRFCVYCAAPLQDKSNKKNKTIMPPQDIKESILERGHAKTDEKTSINPSPIIGLIVLGGILFFASQYLVQNFNVYEIQAIETTQNLDN